MSSTNRAWMVAGTIGLVEALKDQGFAWWNYTIRTIHHHAKSNLRSLSHTKHLPSPTAMASAGGKEEKGGEQSHGRSRGRPKMTLNERIRQDLLNLHLSEYMVEDRSSWRHRVKIKDF